MLRKIYLEGEMGEKFGTEFEVGADNFRDALRCVDCNVEGLRAYLLDCEDKGIGFILDVAGVGVEEADHMLLSVKEGDMTISPQPAGAKSGAGKILAAIAIAVITYYTFGGGTLFANAGTGGGALGFSAATTANIALVGYTLAINLALSGIQQLMAPDPATDNEAGNETYLFNGSQQNIVEGDPVPVLYGELRIPGRPISFEMLNQEFTETTPSLSFRGGVTPRGELR